MTTEQKILYTIVEDHPLVRSGLRTEILKISEYQLLNEFSNMPDLIDHKFTTHPTFLLLDIELPGIDGIEGFPDVKRNLPNTKIIAVTQYEDIQKILKDKGFNGYVNKKSEISNIVSAIAQVLSGKDYFSEPENNIIYGNIKNSKLTQILAEWKIPQREREVNMQAYCGEGMTSKQISRLLNISKNTVDTHRKNFIQHTGIKNPKKLIELAEAIKNEDLMRVRQLLESAKYKNRQ